MGTKPIPEGYHTVTPYLIVNGAAKLADFMAEAFDAEEGSRFAEPGGPIRHTELRIGDSVVMLADASEGDSTTSSMIHLYVEDVDAVYRRALEAGATSMREPQDQFYGDRSAGVKDEFGNQWWIATHVEDVSPEEMRRRAEAFAQQ